MIFPSTILPAFQFCVNFIFDGRKTMDENIDLQNIY